MPFTDASALDLSGGQPRSTRTCVPPAFGHSPSMNIAELPISVDRERLGAFCRERGVRRLSLFGSVLRPDFDPVRSDVDMLIEYLPGHVPGFDFVAHQTELSRLLARRVDLNTPRCLSHRLRDDVQRNALVIYEQP
jgi:hypothetical protein